MDAKNSRSLKFGFSEKATKFEEIFVILLTRASYSVRATAYLSKSQFSKTNVANLYLLKYFFLIQNKKRTGTKRTEI